MSNKKRTHTKARRSSADRGSVRRLAGFLSVVLFLGLAITAGFYWEQNSTIRDVRFTGYNFTSQEDLTASFEAPVGMHADSVNFMDLIRQVKTLPYVRDASVQMEASGSLTFRVEERQPLALLIENDQRAFTDSEGIILPLILEKQVDVPLLYGFQAPSVGDTLKSEAFLTVRDFLVSARSNKFGWATLSEVTYNQREGVIALSHENGVKLLFGSGDFGEKLRYWETFYAEVVRTKGIRNFSSIDLRFRNQIVTHEE
ncbi:MAG: cell division protein FtsQ/DivIB [Balneolaceae bacterium]